MNYLFYQNNTGDNANRYRFYNYGWISNTPEKVIRENPGVFITYMTNVCPFTGASRYV